MSEVIVKGDSVRVPMPPSLNSAYHNIPGRGRVLSKTARAWKDRNVPYIALKLKRFDGSVRISIVFHLGTSFRGDLSNRFKFAEDALKSAGIITDDNHKVVRGGSFEIGEPSGQSLSEITIRVVAA